MGWEETFPFQSRTESGMNRGLSIGLGALMEFKGGRDESGLRCTVVSSESLVF